MDSGNEKCDSIESGGKDETRDLTVAEFYEGDYVLIIKFKITQDLYRATGRWKAS